MKFLTPVILPNFDFKISPKDRVLVVGSCFAQSIGDRLAVLDGVVNNPFGVLYNPLSIADAADALKQGRQFSASDLVFRDGLWHSFAHHGSFSDSNAGEVLRRINRTPAPDFDYIIITLGSAYVYERSGVVVANCHKFPEVEFTRRRANVGECADALKSIAELYPASKIILTVSPIRHLRDGLAANFLSKSTLRLAIAEIAEFLPQQVFYFPSYEILTDELRDYRYTTADMCHPTEQAAAYIFEKFSACALSDSTIQTITQAEKQAKHNAHRPLHGAV